MSAVASDPLEAALLYLASVCDGAASDDGRGFNGTDAAFGHSLAGQAGRWSARQRATARELVQKYRRQVLAATGIDVTEIHTFEAAAPVAVAVPAPPPKTPTARDVLGPAGSIARQLPGYEYRASQLAMADLVTACIAAGEHGVIEAGTGTGKSLGYLVPALLSGKRTIVSTAVKSLQDQLVEKDLPFLQTVMPRVFTVALLKGRSNYLCLHRVARLTDKARTTEPDFLAVTAKRTVEAARSNADAWERLLAWREETASGDLDSLDFALPSDLRAEVAVTAEECIGKHCPLYGVCFAERAKARAKEADVVVVNHALLVRDLAIRAASDGMACLLPDADVLVVDEAHRLAESATDGLGGEVTAARWKRIDKRLQSLTIGHDDIKLGTDLLRMGLGTEADQAKYRRWVERAEALYFGRATAVGDFLARSVDAIKARLAAVRGGTQVLGDESLLAIAAAMLGAFADGIGEETPEWLADELREVWRRTVAQIRKLGDDLAVAAAPGDGETVRYAAIEGPGTPYERVVLHLKPVDVAEPLRELLWGGAYRTVVATSATLADGDGFGHWRARVGLDRARELAVLSPFDYATHALLYLPPDGRTLDASLYRGGDEAAYFDALATTIGQLLAASRGRAFCLFTSYRALRECYDRLWSTLPYRVLKQGDRPRGALLAEFKEDAASVLFATRSFWEGIDVVGEALSLVVIDKLPFTPPDDPLWEAQCAAVNARAGDRWAWFGELAVPAATIALKQGVGRLIRSRTDTGVFAVLDGRLVSKRYGATVLRALPPAPATQSLEDVRAFFAR